MRVFQYRKHGGNLYPTVPIQLIHCGKAILTDALIDSGSNISIFRSEYAELLGIPIERGKKTSLKGIAGELECFIHKINAKVVDNEFEYEIAFSKKLNFPLNLLGRKQFFEKHEITFNEKEKRITINEA